MLRSLATRTRVVCAPREIDLDRLGKRRSHRKSLFLSHGHRMQQLLLGPRKSLANGRLRALRPQWRWKRPSGCRSRAADSPARELSHGLAAMTRFNTPSLSCPTCTEHTPIARSPNPRAQPAVIRHSRLRTRKGSKRRYRCKSCLRTFTARACTPYHRLRSSPETFDRVVRMGMEGMSKAAIARSEQVSPSTVGRWLERAAGVARKHGDAVVRDVVPEELQADEVRGIGPTRDDRHFVFAAIETRSRLWLSHRVGGRTRRNCRLLMREARARCSYGAPRVLIVTDPFRYYREAVKRAWGVTAVHVESGKIIRKRRVVRVRNRLVLGTRWQLEDARARCTTSKKINTAYIERLNLMIRRALAYMQRRTTSLAQRVERLIEAMDLLQCYYNFVRPHESLRFGKEKRTPAMEAGLVTRVLRLRDIFMAFGPAGRVDWIRDEGVRNEWGRTTGWAVSNS